MTSDPFRVLVTGSRDWAQGEVVISALACAAAQCHAAGTAEMIVVHGACGSGADFYAAAFPPLASGRWPGLQITAEPHPARWHQDGHFRKSAGFDRNAEMAALGAGLCLAFLAPCSSRRCRQKEPHFSHGTTHMAGLADQAGIETRRFTMDVTPCECGCKGKCTCTAQGCCGCNKSIP
jgi:hypothetical protein